MNKSFLIFACLILCASAAWAQNTVVLQGQPTPQQMQAYNLMQQAIGQIQGNNASQAKQMLEQAVQLWPDMPHVHYYLGFAAQGAADYASAIPEFQKAIQADRQRIDCMINIGTCYQLLGKPADAATWFKRYLQEKPDSPKAAQVKAMIAALGKQAATQPAGDIAAPDYTGNIAINGKYRRWSPRQFPLKIYISNGLDDTNKAVGGFKENYNYILLDAINAWVQASGNRLSYVVVPSMNNADIVCVWTDDATMRGAGGTQAEQGLALRNEQELGDGSVQITHARITILIRDKNTGSPLSDDQLKKACLHELGHALGLAGHSMNNQDLMFYTDSPSIQPVLSARDQMTIARLYQGYAQVQR